jgi:Flp pilus assembly pilin Flp
MIFHFSRIAAREQRRLLDASGAVAVELAIVASFLALLIVGVVDFSAYLNGSQAVAAAARVGAEYARGTTGCYSSTNSTLSATCVGTVDPPAGILGAMQSSAGFNPQLSGADLAACDATGTSCLSCYCESKATPLTFSPCNVTAGVFDSCYTRTDGYTGPNHVFVAVSGSQATTPILAWPGFPTEVNGLAQMELQ